MRTVLPFFVAALLIAGPALASPSGWYRGDGRPASLAALVDAARGADVVFLGEQHDDDPGHALELTVFEALATAAAGARPVALSLEMLERDVQPMLDEHLAGLIREKDFLAAARPWKNHESAYRPLLEAARRRGLRVLAANVPQRYASRVAREGPDALAALPSASRGWLPASPWPRASQAYEAAFRAFAAAPMPTASPAPAAHTPSDDAAVSRMFAAQWLKDVAMAEAIATELSRRPGTLVVHVTGVFHVRGGLGTVEALRALRPATRSLVVAILPDPGYPAFVPARMTGAGDFVAVTPSR